MKKTLALVLALAMLLMLAACAASTPAATTDASAAENTGTTAASEAATEEKPACVSGDTIKIGFSIPRTGNSAELGTNSYNSAMMALEEINAAGGILGKPVELVIEDSQNDAKQAVEIAKRFISDDSILMTLTGDSSTCNIACANYYQEAEMCLLAANASNAALTPMGDYIFSVAGRSTDESPFSINGVIKDYMGVERLAIIYVNSDWGAGLYETEKELCKDAGIEIVAAEQFNEGETDFSSVISKMRKESPDAVLVVAQYAEGGLIVKQIRKSGWDVAITTTGAVVNDDFLSFVGEDAEGICGYAILTFSDAFPASMSFYNEYVSRFDRTPTIHATVYEGLKIIAEAANRCGDNLNRQSIREELAATKDFEGLNGPVTIEQDGNVSRLWQVVKVQDGVWTKAD